jgi:hypothetical protein
MAETPNNSPPDLGATAADRFFQFIKRRTQELESGGLPNGRARGIAMLEHRMNTRWPLEWGKELRGMVRRQRIGHAGARTHPSQKADRERLRRPTILIPSIDAATLRRRDHSTRHPGKYNDYRSRASAS